jgi:4-hydroxy-3-polyprenylbenzoate decarboxylase
LVSPDAPALEVVKGLAAARTHPVIPPTLVHPSDAPCNENILLGSDMDVFHFPTP